MTSNSDLDREQNNEFENNSQIKENKEELSNDTNYNLPKINLLEKFENKEFKQSILFLNKNNSYFPSEYNEKKNLFNEFTFSSINSIINSNNK